MTFTLARIVKVLSKAGFTAALLMALGGLGLSPARAADDNGTTARKPAASTKSHRATSHGARTTSRRAVSVHSRQRAVRVSMRRGGEDLRPSLAATLGLRGTDDDLDLKSSVALVIDQETNEVLFQKNTQAVLPIASITKLMTALVVLDAHLPEDETLRISDEDRDLEKGSSSRLRVGTELSRGDMLLLALMSSENRAASALSRHYPGGKAAFIDAMNRKAAELGMHDTHFADPTGLTSRNVSSAGDLVKLVNAAYQQPLIRRFSTQPEYEVRIGHRPQHFINTNRLVRGGQWDIGVQKTGYISEAGRCLVMQAKVLSHPVVMVFLDSVGKVSRFADAVRVRHWLENNGMSLLNRASSPRATTADAHDVVKPSLM